MKQVTAKAPVRIDFAGGTLDMPPLYIFHHPVWTTNAAVDLYASASVTKSAKYEVLSKDQDAQVIYSAYSQELEDKNPKLRLILRALSVLNIGPVRVETNCCAPAGAGLGGSSALLVALHAALFKYMNIKMSDRDFIEHVKTIETCVIRVPTGYQDYWGAYYGGVNCYQVALNGTVRKEKLGSKAFKKRLEKDLMLIYAGKPRFSGANNWEMFKRNIDGNRETLTFFEKLRDNALEMREAFKDQNIKNIARTMTKDWHTRKKMIPNMSTPEIDTLEKEVTKHGAQGLRVCGAGGGGCIAIMASDGQEKIKATAEKLGMRVLNIHLVSSGARVDVANI